MQVSPISLAPNNIHTNFEQHSICPSQIRELVHRPFLDNDDFSLQYVTTDNAILAIQRFGSGCFMAKPDIVSLFRIFPAHPDDWGTFEHVLNGFYYFDRVLPFGIRPAPFVLTSPPMPLSGYCKTAVRYPVSHILDDVLTTEPPAFAHSDIA